MNFIELCKLANELLDQLGGDRHKVYEKLKKLAGESEDLSEALIDFAADELSRNAMGKKQRKSEITSLVEAQVRGRASQAIDMKNGRAKNLMIDRAWGLGFVMPLSGKPDLGDCKRDQVVQSVAFFSKLSRTNQHRSQWLQRIADKIPGDSRKTVRDILSNDQVKGLRLA